MTGPLSPAAQALLADPSALRAKILAEKARRSGSRSFSAFVKQAWEFVPTMDPLEWNWHMDALCLHYEAVARGEIEQLLVNIPPGYTKSVLLAVLWPAWIWTWWPKCQMFFGSYSEGFALRDAGRCRGVIESDWYKANYSRPAGWSIKQDQNAKGYFGNTAGGERFASGVGGTGRRAHVVGIDDPLDAEQRHSKAVRDSTNEWIGVTMSQRFIDARRPKIAMTMQRLHAEDPSWFVQQGGGWEVVMLPTEYEPARKCVTYRKVERDGQRVREKFWEDPRTVAGELLFPQRFPREVIEEFKRPNKLGADGFAALQQQQPTPEGGGMFKVNAWRFWKRGDGIGTPDAMRPRGCADPKDSPAVPLPMMERMVISMDATFKKTEKGSFVAIHTWGRAGANRYLLDRSHARLDFNDSVKALLSMCANWPRAVRKLVEKAANGEAIISTLQHRVPGLIGVPADGSKEARAASVQPYQAAGNCYLPDGAPWLGEFIAECAAFPNGPTNDDVDAMSMALRDLEADEKFAEIGSVNWNRR